MNDSQKVELNHFFVGLKASTVDAIADSKFINEKFGFVEKREVKTTSGSWRGTYLFGKSAYLELFSPGGAENIDEGCAGIGFSTLKIGDTESIRTRLNSLATALGFGSSHKNGFYSYRLGKYKFGVKISNNPDYRIRKAVTSLKKEAPCVRIDVVFG